MVYETAKVLQVCGFPPCGGPVPGFNRVLGHAFSGDSGALQTRGLCRLTAGGFWHVPLRVCRLGGRLEAAEKVVMRPGAKARTLE